MPHATQVIKRPLITEKCTWEAAARNRYGFIVDLHADKGQIKRAIVELYGVRVEKVNTQIRKGTMYRTKGGYSRSGNWKKAVVHVHPEDKIDLF